MRFKDQFKISVCFKNVVKHYEINTHGEKYSLEGGREFDTIIQLIDYYHRCADGLLVKLLIPYSPHNLRYVDQNELKQEAEERQSNTDIYEQIKNYDSVMNDEEIEAPKYVDDEPINHTDVSDLKNVPDSKHSLFQDEENYIYDFIPQSITYNDIQFFDQLGKGNFGVVVRGLYFIKDENDVIKNELPVAVKTLNVENDEDKDEFLKEAQTMLSLKHKNIIKLIGVSFYRKEIFCYKIDAFFSNIYFYCKN